MNITHISSRRERRESAKELTVSTWHNGTFGCWKWSQLTRQEQLEFEESRRRAAHVHINNIYA